MTAARAMTEGPSAGGGAGGDANQDIVGGGADRTSRGVTGRSGRRAPANRILNPLHQSLFTRSPG